MNATEQARNRLDAAIRAYPKLGAQAWPEIKAAVGDIEAAAVAEGNLEMLLLLEWLARRGDDPIWQGLQVNYCPATGVYTYFGYRASREITRAEALALLEGGAGDKGRGTNNTTCNP